MKYAYISNNILQDVVSSNPHLLFSAGYASQFVEVPDNVSNGWIFDGADYHPPNPPGTVSAAPSAVTMRQARLALLSVGLLDDVETAINSLPSPQKEAARIEWEYSQEVQRHNGFVSILAPSLGLTEESLDNLFIEAAKL